MSQFKNSIFYIAVCLISVSILTKKGLGRSPAIEPVRGIELPANSDFHPKNSFPGHDFSTIGKVKTEISQSTTNTDFLFPLVILLFLPLIVRFVVFRDNANSSQTEKDNVIPFGKKGPDDGHDKKKAS